MRFSSFTLAAASLLATLVLSTHRCEAITLTTYPAKGRTLNKNSLYAVEIKCKERGRLGPVSQDGLFGKIFADTKYTFTHAVIVSTKPATQLPDGTSKLPDSALGLTYAYITSEKGSEIDNRRACDTSFLVKRTDALFLIPAINAAKDVQPGVIFSAISSALNFLTPLSPIFLAHRFRVMWLKRSQRSTPLRSLLGSYLRCSTSI